MIVLTAPIASNGFKNRIIAEINKVLAGIDINIEFWRVNNVAEMIDMNCADYNYGRYERDDFAKTGDLATLFKNLYNQDTAAREQYGVVFDLIEEKI